MSTKSGMCRCGRRTYRENLVCSYCEQGRKPPRPDVTTLPVDYLIECANELMRRRNEMTTTLKKIGVEAA